MTCCSIQRTDMMHPAIETRRDGEHRGEGRVAVREDLGEGVEVVDAKVVGFGAGVVGVGTEVVGAEAVVQGVDAEVVGVGKRGGHAGTERGHDRLPRRGVGGRRRRDERRRGDVTALSDDGGATAAKPSRTPEK
eukprot:gene1945-biopygen3508